MTNPILHPSSVSANAVDEDAVLNLNVDDLNWQGKQTTSLCDRFGVHMFTEKFRQAEIRLRQEEKEMAEDMFESVMFREEPIDSGMDQIFDTVMAAETEVIIKADYSTDTAAAFDIAALFYILGGIMAAGVVLWLVERRRKKKCS